MQRVSSWVRGLMNKRKTHIQILIYFVIACVSILVVSNLFLYLLSSRIILQDIGDHSEELLSNSAMNTSEIMDANLDYARKSISSSTTGTSIRSYAIQNNNDTYENYNVWRLIVETKEKNHYLDSVFVYNDNTKTVVDSKSGVSDANSFYDQEIIRILQNWTSPTEQLILPRFVDSNDIYPIKARLITIVIRFGLGETKSAIVLNINSDTLLTLFNKSSNSNEGDVFILDQNNIVISSTEPSNFLENFSTMNYSLSFPQKHGWFEGKIAGKNMLVVYANTSFQGLEQWKIIQTIPMDTILNKIHNFRNITLIFFLVLLIITFWIVWKLSQKIYSPIQELIMNVTSQYRGQSNGEENEAGELSFLSKVFTEQHQKIDEFSRNHKYLAKEAFIKDLLESNPYRSIASVQHDIKTHEFELEMDNLALALFRIDHFYTFSEMFSDLDQRLLRFAMTNIAKEHLQAFTPIESTDMGVDHIAVIFNVANENELLFLNQELTQCQSLMKQFLSLDTTVTLGPFTENMMEINDTYKTTLELSNERFNLGWGQLITIHTMQASVNPGIHYPAEKERQLLQAMKKGDKAQAFQLLQVIWTYFQNCTYAESKLFTTNLILSIGKTLRELPLKDFQFNNWNLSNIQLQIEKLETLDAVLSWLNSILSQALEDLWSAANSSKYHNLIHNIKKLIDEHLENPNLSTKMLSDELDLSVNYIRNLFKTETNQSIMDYITDKRLELFTNKIISTNLSIDEIIIQCGFSSTVSFYPIFKKRYGLTPAMYRKENKGV